MRMTKSGLVCIYCVLLFRFIELMSFGFVSMIARGLAGKTYSRDIFHVEGCPLQRFIVMVYYMYSQVPNM